MSKKYIQFLRRLGEIRIDVEVLAFDQTKMTDALFKQRCMQLNDRIDQMEVEFK